MRNIYRTISLILDIYFLSGYELPESFPPFYLDSERLRVSNLSLTYLVDKFDFIEHHKFGIDCGYLGSLRHFFFVSKKFK